MSTYWSWSWASRAPPRWHAPDSTSTFPVSTCPNRTTWLVRDWRIWPTDRCSSQATTSRRPNNAAASHATSSSWTPTRRRNASSRTRTTDRGGVCRPRATRGRHTRGLPGLQRRQWFGGRPVVTPVTVSRDLLGRVVPLVDTLPVGTVLDVPAARSPHVERDHLVVGVPTERGRQRELPPIHVVLRTPHRIEAVDLDHQMHQSRFLTVWGRAYRETVVTFVDPHEPYPRGRVLIHPEGAPWQETEHLGVEGVGILRTRCRQHHVPHPLIA